MAADPDDDGDGPRTLSIDKSVAALLLSIVWIEADPDPVRQILLASGVVFLILTALVARWARSIRDQFAPQDDLVEVEV